MRILKEDTLCLIIDFQSKLMPSIEDKEVLINNTTKLLNGLKVLNIPFIVTEQYKKGIGETIEEIAEVIGENTHFEKLTFSCWYDEATRKAIIDSKKKNIIICGIEAHICVLQTVIDLIENGFNVILVEDCIGSRNNRNKEIAIKRAISEGAVITSYESILFELLRVSRTAEFKEISKIIK